MPGWRNSTKSRSTAQQAVEDEAGRQREEERLTRAYMDGWEEEFGSLGQHSSSVAAFLASGRLPESDDEDELLPPRPLERRRATSLPPQERPSKRLDGGEFETPIEFIVPNARPKTEIFDDFLFSPPPADASFGTLSRNSVLFTSGSEPADQPPIRRVSQRRHSAPLSAPMSSQLKHELTTIISRAESADEIEQEEAEEEDEVVVWPPPTSTPLPPAAVVQAKPSRPSIGRRFSAPLISLIRHEKTPSPKTEEPAEITPATEDDSDVEDDRPLGLKIPLATPPGSAPLAGSAPKVSSPPLPRPTRPKSSAWTSRLSFHIPPRAATPSAESTLLPPRMPHASRRHSTIGIGEVADRLTPVHDPRAESERIRAEAERILTGWRAPTPSQRHDHTSVTNPHFLPKYAHPPPAPFKRPNMSAFPSTTRPRPLSLALPSHSQSTGSLPRLSSLAPAHTFRSPTPFDRPELMQRNTLVELSQNLGSNPTRGTHEKPARLDGRTPPAKERIIVNDWKPKVAPKPKPRQEPKIMDLMDLERRHKRKLKQMQTPAVNAATKTEEHVLHPPRPPHGRRASASPSRTRQRDESPHRPVLRESRSASRLGDDVPLAQARARLSTPPTQHSRNSTSTSDASRGRTSWLAPPASDAGTTSKPAVKSKLDWLGY